jgi:ribosomal protein L7/L12
MLPDDLKQQALKLRAEGRLIEAIKLVKERMDCGLKEAKDAVDELR